MRKVLEQCPACGGPLVITEICCTRCETQVRGQFTPGEWSALSAEQLTFVKIFLRARGNLSEVEKTLGISYPTIRNKLDEIVKALDRTEMVPPAAPSVEAQRRAILEQVATGVIPAAEGLAQLRNLKGAN
jgi:hypothetical protein